MPKVSFVPKLASCIFLGLCDAWPRVVRFKQTVNGRHLVACRNWCLASQRDSLGLRPVN